MIALKREVVEALLKDEEWSKKLENAKTFHEALDILIKFCKIKGFKVKIVE